MGALGAEYRGPPAGLRARIGLGGDPPGLTRVLARDVVAFCALDDVFDIGLVVSGLDEEERRVGPDLLVLREGHDETFDARKIAALADDVHLIVTDVRQAAVQAFDLFVDLAKERLVQPDTAGALLHPH